MLGFFIFAIAFVTVLTLVVRLGKLNVRHDLPETNALGLTVLFAGLLLLAWWFVTRGATSEERLVSRFILPSPVEVLLSFPRLHFEQGLVRSAVISLIRVTAGFALATLIAVPLGVYMGTFAPVAAFFRPLALVGSYVPIVIFVPMTLAWWGTSETQKVGFLCIACVAALLPLVIKDISDVPTAYLDVAVTKGASQWQLVRHVLFPVAQANIWEHLRGVYGVGWSWIIFAELVASESGLGHLIQTTESRGQSKAPVYATAIVIVVIAAGCDQLWRLGGQLLFPYQRQK